MINEMSAFSQHYLAQFNIKPSRHIFNWRGMPAYDSGEGTEFFSCEVPITKNGELIEVGNKYKTYDTDRLTVTKMRLSNGYVDQKWWITGIDEETGEEDDLFLVCDFRKLV